MLVRHVHQSNHDSARVSASLQSALLVRMYVRVAMSGVDPILVESGGRRVVKQIPQYFRIHLSMSYHVSTRSACQAAYHPHSPRLLLPQIVRRGLRGPRDVCGELACQDFGLSKHVMVPPLFHSPKITLSRMVAASCQACRESKGWRTRRWMSLVSLSRLVKER